MILLHKHTICISKSWQTHDSGAAAVPDNRILDNGF